MTENKRFKKCLIEFEKTKREFVFNVKEFMRDKGIPVKLTFFGDTFGLDIDNMRDVPRKIPLDVLTDFCKDFGCEFEYTCCDGNRWIFSFNKLNMGY